MFLPHQAPTISRLPEQSSIEMESWAFTQHLREREEKASGKMKMKEMKKSGKTEKEAIFFRRKLFDFTSTVWASTLGFWCSVCFKCANEDDDSTFLHRKNTFYLQKVSWSGKADESYWKFSCLSLLTLLLCCCGILHSSLSLSRAKFTFSFFIFPAVCFLAICWSSNVLTGLFIDDFFRLQRW